MLTVAVPVGDMKIFVEAAIAVLNHAQPPKTPEANARMRALQNAVGKAQRAIELAMKKIADDVGSELEASAKVRLN